MRANMHIHTYIHLFIYIHCLFRVNGIRLVVFLDRYKMDSINLHTTTVIMRGIYLLTATQGGQGDTSSTHNGNAGAVRILKPGHY
jgi:hypothetical protein